MFDYQLLHGLGVNSRLHFFHLEIIILNPDVSMYTTPIHIVFWGNENERVISFDETVIPYRYLFHRTGLKPTPRIICN